MATNPGALPTTTNTGDSSPQLAGGFGACDTAKPCSAVPTLQEADAAGNTSDVDVDQQLLPKSAGGDSFPDIPLPDIPLPDVPLPEAFPDDSVGKK